MYNRLLGIFRGKRNKDDLGKYYLRNEEQK